MKSYAVNPLLIHRIRRDAKVMGVVREDVAELVEAYVAMKAVLGGFAEHVDDVTREIAKGDPFRTGEIMEAAKEILAALAVRKGDVYTHATRAKQ